MTTTDFDDAWERTRRRGNALDEQAMLRALVRRQRSFAGALAAAGHKLKAAPTATHKPSQRVGEHNGHPTRTVGIRWIKIPKPAGMVAYIDRLNGIKVGDLEANGGLEGPEFTRQATEREQSIREAGVKNRTAVLEQNIELPRDTTPEVRIAIVKELVRGHEHEVTWAIHTYGENGSYQPHVHILWLAGPQGQRPIEGGKAMVADRHRVADTINRVAFEQTGRRLEVEWFGGKDCEMDRPGIVGRPPKRRKSQPIYECQKKRDELLAAGKPIPERIRRLAEAGDRHDEMHRKAAEAGLAETPKSGKEARIADYKRMKEEADELRKPFSPASKKMGKMIVDLARKAKVPLPDGWETRLHGGDVMAALKAAKTGGVEAFDQKIAEAEARAARRAEILSPILAAQQPDDPASAADMRFDPKIRAVARREIETAVNSAAEAEKWHQGADEASRAFRERLEWQIALDEALAASQRDLEAQAFTQAGDAAGAGIASREGWVRDADDVGRDLEERIRWQESIDAAIADGERYQFSVRIAQAGEMAGADIIARRAWNIAAAEAERIEFTSTTTLDKLKLMTRRRQDERKLNTVGGIDRNAEPQQRSGQSPARRPDAVRNLEEYPTARTASRPESDRGTTGSDHGIDDRDLRRAESAGGNNGTPGADTAEARATDRERIEQEKPQPRYSIGPATGGQHRVYDGKKQVGILMPQISGGHSLTAMNGMQQNAGPLLPFSGIEINATLDVNKQLELLWSIRVENTKQRPPSAEVKPSEARKMAEKEQMTMLEAMREFARAGHEMQRPKEEEAKEAAQKQHQLEAAKAAQEQAANTTAGISRTSAAPEQDPQQQEPSLWDKLKLNLRKAVYIVDPDKHKANRGAVEEAMQEKERRWLEDHPEDIDPREADRLQREQERVEREAGRDRRDADREAREVEKHEWAKREHEERLKKAAEKSQPKPPPAPPTAPTAPAPPSPSATPTPAESAASMAEKGLVQWPKVGIHSNAEARQQAIMVMLKEASPSQLEKMRSGNRKALAENKIVRPTYVNEITDGLKKIEGVMTERGILATDDTPDARLKAAREKSKQRADQNQR